MWWQVSLPGGAVPCHYHNGLVVGTVISGEATLLSREGGEQIFKTGQSWIEKPNEVGEFINRSPGYAYIVATYLVPKGAAATTFLKKTPRLMKRRDCGCASVAGALKPHVPGR